MPNPEKFKKKETLPPSCFPTNNSLARTNFLLHLCNKTFYSTYNHKRLNNYNICTLFVISHFIFKSLFTVKIEGPCFRPARTESVQARVRIRNSNEMTRDSTERCWFSDVILKPVDFFVLGALSQRSASSGKPFKHCKK